MLIPQPQDLIGKCIGLWFEARSDATSSEWFHADTLTEGTLRLKESQKNIYYRLEPMASAAFVTGGGAILFLGDDRLALDLIHAQAFQLNPGLSAISVMETGEHLDVNPAWLAAMEYERSDVISKTARDMNIWEFDSFRTEVVNQLSEYGRVENLEGRMRTKSGKLRNIIVSAEVVSYSSRKLAIFASHDITEVKQSHAELEALNRQLEARVEERTAELAAKNTQLLEAVARAESANNAKGRFLATMSHEIRTPLNAIINMAELMAEETRDGPHAHYLSNIVNSAQALAAIVNDTLDFARIEADRLHISPVEVNLETIVEEVARSLAPLGHRKGVELVLTITPQVTHMAYIDPTRLRQILYNLVGNAIKYTRKGWVWIDLDFAATNGRQELLLSIHDTGVGIDQIDQNRIFDRFSQINPGADSASSGTGLGLSIALGIIHAMEGTISVDSQAGQGSTFRVTLPVLSHSSPTATGPLQNLVVFGPNSKTRSTLQSSLVGMGVTPEIIDEISPTSVPWGDAVALVVLPLSASTAFVKEWINHARSLCSHVVILSPVGLFTENAIEPLPDGESVEFYPIGKDRLLSALRSQPALAEPVGQPLPAKALAGVNILIADDVEENRLVVEWGLKACGANVTTVENGAHAIQLLEKKSFDLILMDLRMPGLDGYQTASRIRSLKGRAGQTPIIAVSANVTPDLPKMESSGISDFLPKPFRPSDLRSIVLRTLNRTSPEKHNPPVQEHHLLLDSDFLAAQLHYAG